MEISDVRRSVRQRIEQARRLSAERRARVEAAERAYQTFLSDVATPVFQQFANALRGEGYPFKVFTPAGGLRLMSDRSAGDFIELALDVESDPPGVLARVNRGRGSRLVTAERAVHPDAAIQDITDQDVLQFLLNEIGPFVER
jgi:hypothetical protein